MFELRKAGFSLAASVLAGVGLLGVSWVSAGAATFQYSGYGVVNAQGVTIAGDVPDTGSGYLAGQIDLYGTGANLGQTIDAWCIDAYHILQGSDTYTVVGGTLTSNGTITTGPADFNNLTNVQQGEIGALVRWGDAHIANYNNSAAAQIAIWTIEYGPGATFTSTTTVDTIANHMVSYVENHPGVWNPNLLEVVDGPGNNQGLVYVPGGNNGSLNPTPLPATWTMMLIGFAGLGFFAYRGRTYRSGPIQAA